MKYQLKLLLSSATILALTLPVTTTAQIVDEDELRNIDEIVVTARKREESLNEVPVSISVLNESLIEDTNILTQDDLFSLVPGISYSETFDRNSAAPNVRGVQSNEVATNRTKVTQFIDGMPILGSQGNIQFGSVQQVEVFRGPQSAAFGRSTFGGAINYVTKDPGDEFAAELTADFNDYGTRRIGGSVGGPITETLGFLIDAQWEDSTAPDDFIATDGTRLGERSSKAASGKLVWAPTDNLEAELTYSHVQSADSPTASYFITQEARDACFDGTTLTGMGTGVYANGELNCDWSQGAQIVSQVDRVPALQGLIDSGFYGDITAEQEADLLFLADATGIREDRVGAFDNRDRMSLQVDYTLGNGALIQASAFIGDENYIRETDNNSTVDPIVIGFSPTDNMGMAVVPEFPYVVTTGGPNATVGGIMADPSEINEKYAEIRYVSPGEDRLRYVVGGSFYDYDFVTNLYFLGYTAFLEGNSDRYQALTGEDISIPTQVFQEVATNVGVFGNLSYDITDRLTVTGEARYQIDKVGGFDTITNEGGELTTKAFLPRLSANYNVSDTTSFYVQYAKGNNPAGVNVGFFNTDNVAQLDCTDPITVLGPNGTSACGQNYVNYTSEDFKFFEEEKITNYEVGMKGALFDNRVQFAAAAFLLDWTNQGQSANLDWDDPLGDAMAMNDFTGNRTFINEGDIQTKGVEFESTFNLDDNFSVRAQGSILNSKYKDYCDVALEDNGLPGTESFTGVNWRSAEESGTGYSCVDVSGNNVPNTPSFSGSISPSWRSELENGLGLNVRGDIRHTGNVYTGNYNFLQLPAVTTANVSAGISGEKWSLTAYVNNLTNEDQPNRVGSGDDDSITVPTVDTGAAAFNSNYSITPRARRSFGIRGNVRY